MHPRNGWLMNVLFALFGPGDGDLIQCLSIIIHDVNRDLVDFLLAKVNERTRRQTGLGGLGFEKFRHAVELHAVRVS